MGLRTPLKTLARMLRLLSKVNAYLIFNQHSPSGSTNEEMAPQWGRSGDVKRREAEKQLRREMETRGKNPVCKEE